MADIADDVQNSPNDETTTKQVKTVLTSYFCIHNNLYVISLHDAPPYPQPSKGSLQITSFVIFNHFDDFGVGTKVPLIHQGHFKREDPHPLIEDLNCDQALVSRFPKTPIDIPPVV